jgi:large subunit ribosomal protein L3
MKQIIGRKIGMISLFESNGQMIAGTVVLCEPNVIVEKKNNSVNVGYFQISEKKLLKSKLGVFTKNSIQPRKYIKNLKTDNDYKIGDEINVDLFEVGE